MLSDTDLERYSRQLMLPDFSIDQQERLAASRVLVVGCGGLGHPLALYLAGAGIGQLVLADGDCVERSNLPRQLLFGEEHLGMRKAEVLAQRLGGQFPDCGITALPRHLDDASLPEVLAEDAPRIDLIADCSDNYAARFALNRAAVRMRLPLVSASAVRAEGQLAVFDAQRGTPCYRCVYPDSSGVVAQSCRDSGVLGPVVGVLGTLQALEVIKCLTGWGEALYGTLLYLDLRDASQRRLALERRAGCPDCAG
ncbi:MAG: HesA/MoeB/ThiF family protein [Halieaceae bacterium]|nr:HesA/MoeB/ThiF family protein [Halieaceae bacterium]